MFRIASATDASLYLTSPANPKNGSKLYMDTKYEGVGQSVQQQLWRFLPGGGHGNSAIQCYTTEGLTINIPSGDSGVPIQLWSSSFSKNECFYIDIAA